MTTNGRSGFFLAGAGLVWRRQRVLWWAFIINLVLAGYAARGFTARVGPVLDHSLASARLLVHGFHVAALIDLAEAPEHYLRMGPTHFYFSVIFFFFMLLATGGILESYWRDATLSTTEFFQSGGTYFWRFFRMVFFFVIALIPVGLIAWGLDAAADKIGDASVSPYVWAWVEGAMILLVCALLMMIRLWFDMAEVIAVAESEVRSRRCLRRACTLLRRNFGTLFWLYFRVTLVAWVVVLAGLHVWVQHLHHDSIIPAFIVGQLIILLWMGARFWQRASETLWYRDHLARDANHA
ncbi:MAG: hypothetical protein WA002_12555 [Candidatus Acidiferrales bacterium]